MSALHGIEGGGIDLKPEAGRKSHGAQEPQMIFAESRVGVADGPDHAARQIAAPIHEVQHVARVRVHHEPVDGEIAPQHVLARIAFKTNLLGMPAVQVIVVAAESGHLHLIEYVAHQHDSKVRAHPPRTRE